MTDRTQEIRELLRTKYPSMTEENVCQLIEQIDDLMFQDEQEIERLRSEVERLRENEQHDLMNAKIRREENEKLRTRLLESEAREIKLKKLLIEKGFILMGGATPLAEVWATVKEQLNKIGDIANRRERNDLYQVAREALEAMENWEQGK